MAECFLQPSFNFQPATLIEKGLIDWRFLVALRNFTEHLFDRTTQSGSQCDDAYKQKYFCVSPGKMPMQQGRLTGNSNEDILSTDISIVGVLR